MVNIEVWLKYGRSCISSPFEKAREILVMKKKEEEWKGQW